MERRRRVGHDGRAWHCGASVISVSSPGVYFGDDAAAHELAVKTNKEAARLQRAHPSRFGRFASTSLPNVQAAVAEACKALDEWGADGIVVESNQQGMYLGDARLKPFYQALNDRAAVIFVHPTSPKCQGCQSLTLGYPEPMLEFMFETTRTITNMVLSGVTLRYADHLQTLERGPGTKLSRQGVHLRRAELLARGRPCAW